jgi:hypothetical protein
MTATLKLCCLSKQPDIQSMPIPSLLAFKCCSHPRLHDTCAKVQDTCLDTQQTLTHGRLGIPGEPRVARSKTVGIRFWTRRFAYVSVYPCPYPCNYATIKPPPLRRGRHTLASAPPSLSLSPPHPYRGGTSWESRPTPHPRALHDSQGPVAPCSADLLSS